MKKLLRLLMLVGVLGITSSLVNVNSTVTAKTPLPEEEACNFQWVEFNDWGNAIEACWIQVCRDSQGRVTSVTGACEWYPKFP